MFTTFINKPCRLVQTAVATAALVLSVPLASLAQSADDYPSRVISILVGFGAGGASDVTGRLLANHMFSDQGATVIVENKPGAGGRLAAEYFTTQDPDGYSLMIGGNGVISVARAIYPDLSYDPITQMQPISIVAEFPNFILVVRDDHPATSFDELVAWTQANPNAANYPAPAPSYTVPTEELMLATGLEAQRIAYRSGSESLTSVLNGETTFMLADPALALPMLQAGTLRALAVTGDQRMEQLADIPAFEEMGVTVNMRLWTGLFAPAGTPDEIIDLLQAEVARVVQLPEIVETLRGMGLRPGGNSSADYAALINQEVAAYIATVEAANLTFED